MKKIKALFKMKDISTGDYVLLAIPDEEKIWQFYEGYNSQSTDNRLRIINPLKPYNRQTGENCWIHRVAKPITRAFYQVVGIRDGVQVKSIQKGHPRSKPSTFTDKFTIYLNNILDVAKGRDEMIQKRSVLK